MTVNNLIYNVFLKKITDAKKRKYSDLFAKNSFLI